MRYTKKKNTNDCDAFVCKKTRLWCEGCASNSSWTNSNPTLLSDYVDCFWEVFGPLGLGVRFEVSTVCHFGTANI
jgi:hypothetical protein